MANKKKYIESHSSFIRTKKHQYLSDGSTINERDWTTIGNIERHIPNQTPIYQSGNFIITVDNSDELKKDINYGGEELTFTLEELKNIVPNIEETKRNEINSNIYDLRTFAYYGSCTELIRSTISNIIKTFPYELYCSDRNVFYETNSDVINYNNNLHLIINPSNIDLHSVRQENDKYYILTDLSETFQLIDPMGSSYEIPKTIEMIYTSSNGKPQKCYQIGEKIGFIAINSMTIYIYQGPDNTKIYLHDSDGWSIRPKQEIFNSFYNSLSKFEKVLLNIDSTPKYTATFNVITPTDYGIKTIQETFSFPQGDGSWNIGGDEEQFQSYMSRLFKIAEYYDEYYSDNMWRMMTHEAIKNFDWSFNKEINQDLVEKHIEGGEKISKIIRLYGREFDEVKQYIDGISFVNNLNYQDKNTATNEMLPSLLENDGWSLKSWDDTESYNYFLKILRLNSRQILRHKGTKVGIEMLLSLFGLKSSDMSQDNYDYKITEYQYSIVDNQVISQENAEKIAILNSEKDDYDIFNSNKFQGLAVIEYDGKLYPFYDKNQIYDNGLYYQMKGGWIDTSYKPTIVERQTDLESIPYNLLFHNMLIKVAETNTIYRYDEINNEFIILEAPITNIYDLYDIHNGNNNYDNGASYLQTLLDPIKYQLDNNLFNINNKDISNIILNESVTDVFFERKNFTDADIYDAKNISDKFFDNVKDNNIAKSLQIINLKNISIEFSDSFQQLAMELKQIIVFYLQQMIPSTSICKLII